MKKINLTIDGITSSVRAHCKRLGLCYATIFKRHQHGESYLYALTHLEHRPNRVPMDSTVYCVNDHKGTISDLCKIFHMRYRLVYNRFHRYGWAIDRIFTKRLYPRRHICVVNGVRGTIPMLVKRFGKVSLNTAYNRIRCGWSIKLAILTPKVEPKVAVMPKNKLLRPRKTNRRKVKKQHSITYKTKLTYNGETHSYSFWEKKMGYPESTISHRIHRGWSATQAIETPLKKWTSNSVLNPHQRVFMDGVNMTVTEHCTRLGKNCHTILARIRRGMSIEEAFNKPINHHKREYKKI